MKGMKIIFFLQEQDLFVKDICLEIALPQNLLFRVDVQNVIDDNWLRFVICF